MELPSLIGKGPFEVRGEFPEYMRDACVVASYGQSHKESVYLRKEDRCLGAPSQVVEFLLTKCLNIVVGYAEALSYRSKEGAEIREEISLGAVLYRYPIKGGPHEVGG